MKKKSIQAAGGLTDSPVEMEQDDSFGLGKYIQGMSEFILECDTPMTIAIQGDWGSGKTSIMNMLRGKLGGQVETVWFNTWQFSKFKLDDQLVFSLLLCLTEELEKLKPEGSSHDRIINMKKVVGALARVGSYALDALGAQKLAEEAGNFVESALNREDVDLIHMINSLKGDFQNAVDEIYGTNGHRIVIFIDDLDRLNPEKAVDLLEVLKLFLDCRNCVYVLAIDYGVVVRGIDAKYGAGFSQGRKFFDKIIQVPFVMPVAQYDIGSYVKSSMSKIGEEIDEDSCKVFIRLIRHSAGCNPRSMKRVFNAYWMLSKIYRDKDLSSPLKKQLLFACLCMELSFQKVYEAIIENEDILNAEFYNAFREAEDGTKCLDKITEDIDFEQEEYSLQGAAVFLKDVCDILAGKDEKVDEEDVEAFRDILDFSRTANNVQVKEKEKGAELQEDYDGIKTLTQSDLTYGICKLSSDFHIGFGKSVTVEYEGKQYSCRMHSSNKGRVDQFTAFYKDNKVQPGDKFRVSYLYGEKKLILEKITE